MNNNLSNEQCAKEGKKRIKFLRAYYSNSAGGGLYREELSEKEAYARAVKMRKTGKYFTETTTCEKYDCSWGDPAFQHIVVEYAVCRLIKLHSEVTVTPPLNAYKINRKTILFKETVTVYADTAVTWEINSNLVKHPPKNSIPSNKISFTALDKEGIITVYAKNSCYTESIKFIIMSREKYTRKLSNLHNQDIIREEALKANVDPDLMLAIASIETGETFDEKKINTESKASGLFQFIPGTREEYGLDDKTVFDARKNTAAAIAMLIKNRNTFKNDPRFKREPSNWELYLMHQQDSGGARALINHPDTPAVDTLIKYCKSTPKKAINAIKGNGGNTNWTSRQFTEMIKDKVNNSYELYHKK